MELFESKYISPATSEKPEYLLALLHGYSGSIETTLPTAQNLSKQMPEAGILVINGCEPFEDNPHMPIERRPDSRQWFSLITPDSAEFSVPVAHSRIARLVPNLHSFIEAQAGMLGLDLGRVGILGFSQGSLVATFLALARRYGACVGISSGLAVDIDSPTVTADIPGFNTAAFKTAWSNGGMNGDCDTSAQSHKYTPILLLHGDRDQRINYTKTQLGARVLTCIGVEVEAKIFRGVGHEVCDGMIDASVEFLRRHMQFS
ncbi:Alpha/beta hydrolase family [Carpediemonas membranifera]|uniref:Alpha/beta hydrolase family n=1 Tax=Carpediemonas membranifera TaxID=201153 RepID=A0A8J6ARI7_9EUKA|nr:Alpha/beta hydrolase family [Carpediemonas membranifera]|eukprot:KAG9390395.1 Alpha/beta hydrolase family [Carpediemonas membranifera]